MQREPETKIDDHSDKASKTKTTTPVKVAAKLSNKAKKRKRRRKESYQSYIFKVLKRSHPEFEVTDRSLRIMNSLIQSVFTRVANEASSLAQSNNNKTVTTSEIQEAVKLLLPGELAMRAMSRGQEALEDFHLDGGSSSSSSSISHSTGLAARNES